MKPFALLSVAALCLLYGTDGTPVAPRSDQWATATVGSKVFHVAPTGTKTSWWNAHKLCRSKGMELASVESQAETDALGALLAEQDGTEEKVFYWTSGSDRGRAANDFAWFSNGRPINAYSNWDEDEPNNDDGTEDFIHLFSKDGKCVWNDLAESHDASVVCEISKEPIYTVVKMDLNWYEAVRACRQRGARLASIESASDAAKFNAAVRAAGLEDTGYFWSSGTDNGQADNAFFWFSNGNAFSFTAWADAQPDHVMEGVEERCVTVVVPANEGDAEWHDWSCLSEKNFVCEVRG